jgi:hypothetical protein
MCSTIRSESATIRRMVPLPTPSSFGPSFDDQVVERVFRFGYERVIDRLRNQHAADGSSDPIEATECSTRELSDAVEQYKRDLDDTAQSHRALLLGDLRRGLEADGIAYEQTTLLAALKLAVDGLTLSLYTEMAQGLESNGGTLDLSGDAMIFWPSAQHLAQQIYGEG